MTICSKCLKEVKKTNDCEHTEMKQFCNECYTELHYHLTE